MRGPLGIELAPRSNLPISSSLAKRPKLNLSYYIEYYNNSYNHFNSIKSLHIFFREYCSKITLDYKGNPLSGLQIMGLLETRTLDFENIIITSLNEGVLPGGKSQNSFLPHELKIKNNLPTYREKDAIYSYHFYRLLSRANNIHLIYNSETDTLNGGEKSRFITQIEIEGIHNITYKESSKSTSRKKQSLLTITKTDYTFYSITCKSITHIVL